VVLLPVLKKLTITFSKKLFAMVNGIL